MSWVELTNAADSVTLSAGSRGHARLLRALRGRVTRPVLGSRADAAGVGESTNSYSIEHCSL